MRNSKTIPQEYNDCWWFDLAEMLGDYHMGQADPVYAFQSRRERKIRKIEFDAVRKVLEEILDGEFLDATPKDYDVAECWLPYFQKEWDDIKSAGWDERRRSRISAPWLDGPLSTPRHRIRYGRNLEFEDEIDTEELEAAADFYEDLHRKKNPASRSTVSLWLSKDKFSKSQARKWAKDHGMSYSGAYSTDGFWAFPQMSERAERRYKGKIRSKYIAPGVLLKFVPVRFMTRRKTRKKR